MRLHPAAFALPVFVAVLVTACGGGVPRRASPPGHMDALLRERGPFYLHASGGLGMPLGLVGGGAGLRPIPWCSIELGGGVSDSGPQAAALVAARIPVTAGTTLGPAWGPSIGRYSDRHPDFDEIFSESPDEYTLEWDWVLWSNQHLEVRHALDAYTALRFDVGAATVIDHAARECAPEPNSSCGGGELPEILPYLAAGLEWHF
jgi:hypothetical protein